MKQEHSLIDEKMGETTPDSIEDLLQPPLFSIHDILLGSMNEYMSEEDKSALGVTNTFLYGIFQESVENLLKNLCQHVANGDQDSAKKIVARNAELILEKRDVTDPAGRIFKEISALQYAQWSGDWYMLEMLLKSLPADYMKIAKKHLQEVKRHNADGKEDLINQKGIEYQLYLDLDDPLAEITAEVLENAEKQGPGKSGLFLDGRTPVILRQENVGYRVSLPPENYQSPNAPAAAGKTRVLVTVTGERNYDYQPLIVAIKTYAPLLARWKASGFQDKALEAEAAYHWCHKVGGAQQWATAFLAQQYCHRDLSFEEVKWEERTLKRSLDFYDCLKKRTLSWFIRGSGLGSDFGIIPTPGMRTVGVSVPFHVSEQAVEALCKASPEKLASVEREYFPEVALATSHP